MARMVCFVLFERTENYQVGHGDRFCVHEMEEYEKRVHLHRGFVLHICVLNFTCSLVAILGNILIIRALQKALTMPATLRCLLIPSLSLWSCCWIICATYVWCHHSSNVKHDCEWNCMSLCRLFCLYLSLPISQFLHLLVLYVHWHVYGNYSADFVYS